MNTEKTTSIQLSNGHLPLSEQRELTQFQSARTTPTIRESTITDIAQILEQGMLILGIKGENLPDKFSVQYMISELRTEYSGLKLGEFLLAFQLAARGKLDYNVETYQHFSPLYMNRMIAAYHRWAIKQVREMPVKVEETKNTYSTMTDDEILSMALENYQKYRDWEHIFFCMKAFNILHSRGLLNYEVDYVIQETEKRLKQKIYDRDSKKKIYDTLRNEEEMELACRRCAVSMYFDTQVSETKFQFKLNDNNTITKL